MRLGTLEVSRLILGSNPFWGYSHKSARLDEEMRRHHTDERIMQILDEAADCGLKRPSFRRKDADNNRIKDQDHDNGEHPRGIPFSLSGLSAKALSREKRRNEGQRGALRQ